MYQNERKVDRFRATRIMIVKYQKNKHQKEVVGDISVFNI